MFFLILHCPLDWFCSICLLGDEVDDGCLSFVALGWCLGTSDEDVVSKVFVGPFRWWRFLFRVILLLGVGSVVGLTPVGVVGVPVRLVAVPGGVAPSHVVVVVVVVVVVGVLTHFSQWRSLTARSGSGSSFQHALAVLTLWRLISSFKWWCSELLALDTR